MREEGKCKIETAPYNNDLRKEMILRDHLATARTVLANERTILAYLRTALATVAAGVGLIHFAAEPGIKVVGWLMLPLGAACLAVGIIRYFHFKRYIAELTEQEDRSIET